MKKLYVNLLSVCRKGVLLAAVVGTVCFTTDAQVYTAKLTGGIEAPPNASPGTGNTTVTITGNMMRVQADFAGLIGNVTAAHIHATTALPLTGTAGVATPVPSFPGFPAGVQSGTYDVTFDMTLASSYNPAFINNNGGTPASAFAVLLAALNNGRSYLNIHSNVFPGGEIRGFLVGPGIDVSIPDAFALANGTLPNTVYPAYAPASSLTLSANISVGTAPYTYSWSNGSKAATTTVSPTVNTVYTLTVKDDNGCPGMASKTVSVMNIADGKKGDKIMVCHKGGNGLSIAAPAVAAHLNHGDMLGSCTAARGINPALVLEEQRVDALSVRVLANPSRTHFTLQLSGKAGSTVQVIVYDLQGRMLETQTLASFNQPLWVGNALKPGMYIVEVLQGSEKQTLRLVKSK